MAAVDSGSREESIALLSLGNAEQCMLSGNYGRAFANYLLVLKLTPSRKPVIKINFALALSELSKELVGEGRLDDLFMCYQQACELFPECEAMHNCIGTQLFRLGYIDEAASSFRRALRLDPNFLGARDNLDNVCGHLVERWHFRMLNDLERNLRYRDAIHAAISAGHSTVLDIGSGTGLLGLFAADGEAEAVYACEMSKTMYEVSCDVVSANQMQDKIHVIHKHSQDLVILGDLPERVSLVVTETFDAGLIGEHILDTLSHAWKHLLVDKNTAKVPPSVIPAGADVYICAIESPAIRKQNRLIYPGLQNISLSTLDLFCKTTHGSDTPGADNGNQCPAEDEIPPSELFEPYTTERLKTLVGGYKRLTEPVKVFSFNFLNLEEIEKYMAGVMRSIDLKIVQHGHVDALAMWFDLHLDADITLTSAPESNSCWEQAIYPVLPNLQDGVNSLIVAAGNTMEIKCDCQNNMLSFVCRSINRTNMKAQALSSHAVLSKPEYCNSLSVGDTLSSSSSHNNPSDTLTVALSSDAPEHRKQKYLLERHELEKLNDIDYNSGVCDALSWIQSKLGGEGHESLSLMEVTQEMSFLTLQAIQMGWSSVSTTLRQPLHQQLLRDVAEENEMESEMVTFETEDYGELEGDWKVVVMDIVSSEGCMYQHALEDLALLRVTCMSPSSIVVPHKMAVYGMAIESQSLLQDSAVLEDHRTLGFHIAEFVNDFQMQTHVNIDLSTLDYQKLTDPFELFTFSLNDADDYGRFPSYLNQTTSIRVSPVESGQVTAVVYWFDLWLSPEHHICTLDRQLHWKQAAAMQNNCEVSVGREMMVKAACKSSCLSVKVTSHRD